MLDFWPSAQIHRAPTCSTVGAFHFRFHFLPSLVLSRQPSWPVPLLPGDPGVHFRPLVICEISAFRLWSFTAISRFRSASELAAASVGRFLTIRSTCRRMEATSANTSRRMLESSVITSVNVGSAIFNRSAVVGFGPRGEPENL